MSDAEYLNDSTVVSSLRLTEDRMYPYEVRVSNSYTGESRIVSAASRWELDTLIEAEKKRQRSQEVIKRAMGVSSDQRDAARIMTENAKSVFVELSEILAHTLAVDDRLDWDKRLINDNYPEYLPEPAPVFILPEKKGIAKLFYDDTKDREQYRRDVESYKARTEDAIRNYLLERENFEEHKRKNNAEIKFLKKCFENGEKTAVEKYAGIILANSEYPDCLRMDHEIYYSKRERTLRVNFLFFPVSILPVVESYEFSKETQRIVENRLSVDERDELYERVLCDIAVRTVHELFEAIYIDSVESIVFNGFVLGGNRWIEERVRKIAPGGKMRCVFGFKVAKKDFLDIDITSLNSSELLKKFGVVRVRNRFTDVTEMINPL